MNKNIKLLIENLFDTDEVDSLLNTGDYIENEIEQENIIREIKQKYSKLDGNETDYSSNNITNINIDIIKLYSLFAFDLYNTITSYYITNFKVIYKIDFLHNTINFYYADYDDEFVSFMTINITNNNIEFHINDNMVFYYDDYLRKLIILYLQELLSICNKYHFNITKIYITDKSISNYKDVEISGCRSQNNLITNKYPDIYVNDKIIFNNKNIELNKYSFNNETELTNFLDWLTSYKIKVLSNYINCDINKNKDNIKELILDYCIKNKISRYNFTKKSEQNIAYTLYNEIKNILIKQNILERSKNVLYDYIITDKGKDKTYGEYEQFKMHLQFFNSETDKLTVIVYIYNVYKTGYKEIIDSKII